MTELTDSVIILDVERLGAPLTQALNILMPKFPVSSPLKYSFHASRPTLHLTTHWTTSPNTTPARPPLTLSTKSWTVQ